MLPEKIAKNNLEELKQTMSIEIWPFLVSRNTYLDYRTVVAPDFICETKISNLLARVVEGELTRAGQAIIRQVVNSKAGDFTIAFRVIKATEKDINATGENNILKDQFGREIYIFEGIVTKGIRSDFILSERNFQEVHEQLIPSYRKFWDFVAPSPAMPSSSLVFKMESVNNPLVLDRLETFEVRSKIPIPPPEPVEQPSQPKPSKPPLKFLVPLVIIILLAIGLFLQKVLFGKNISVGCATIHEEEIEFKSNDKIAPKLKELRKRYSKASILLLSGSFKVKSKSVKNYNNIEIDSDGKKPTNKVFSEQDKFELNEHPIELAIIDFKNLKAEKAQEIYVKIIDRDKCK